MSSNFVQFHNFALTLFQFSKLLRKILDPFKLHKFCPQSKK